MGFDMGFFNPVGAIGQELGADDNFNFLNDPMDLMGYRAEGSRDEIKQILLDSAKAGIEQMEKQEAYLREQYQPYYEAGLEGAQNLQTMAAGGELEGYKPSRIFEYQKEKGFKKLGERFEDDTAALDESMAARGLLNSSARKGYTEDLTEDYNEDRIGLISGLAAEEADRMYSGQLSMAQIGSRSADALSAAGTATSGKIGGLYANLGEGLNQNQRAYGQNREASWQTAGNTLTNLSGYMQQQGAK